MKHFFWIILLLPSLLVPPWGRASTLYRWKDKNGTIHITDIPPTSGSYETFQDSKEATTNPPISPSAPEPSSPLQPPSSFSKAIYLPLRKAGNHFLVTMTLNDRATGLFLLDTGASLTVISPQISREAGISTDTSSPILPLKTASDIIFPPIVHVGKINLGTLTLPGGDVIIHDIHFGKGVSGLFGMDLLSDYMVTLDTQNATLILKPIKEAGPLYGGHSKKWWRKKFAFYRHAIRSLENLLKTPDKILTKYHLSREKITHSIDYFKGKLYYLKSLAEEELVPLDWRK